LARHPSGSPLTDIYFITHDGKCGVTIEEDRVIETHTVQPVPMGFKPTSPLGGTFQIFARKGGFEP